MPEVCSNRRQAPASAARRVIGLRKALSLAAFAAVVSLGLSRLAVYPSPSAGDTPARPTVKADPARQGHLFRFDARGITPQPKAVYLAGTFNGWNATAEPMHDEGNGVFTLRKNLPDGIHFYKFVADGNKWLNDPNDDKELREDDGNGGMNSAVLIGPDARKLPAPVKGQIQVQAVRFDPADSEDLNVVGDDKIKFSLRTQLGDVEEVSVAIVDNPTPRFWPLYSSTRAMGFERFSGLVTAKGRPVSYLFRFKDGGKTFYWGKDGLKTAFSPDDAFTADAAVRFATPDWARDVVWYQIFPERFRNGDKANDPGDRPFERLTKWTSDWWATQPGETPGAENFYKGDGNVWNRRYGGDIQGVREKLGYLKSLGVTAIYFNPIFEASSMHKYDTRDYRHVDQNLTVRQQLPLPGETDEPSTWKWSEGDKLFLDFVKEAHRQGFKVVLDGVFNHVGRDHPFFQDVMKHGPQSKYAGWFEIEKWADSYPTTEDKLGKPGGMYYKAWDNPSGALPAFKKDPIKGLAPGPYEHVMAVTKRWLAPDGKPENGIDGWRLDVANDIPHGFWVDWRKVVKETKPDAYISGEIWSVATPWLQGDQFDAVMNYQFAMAGQRFFVNTEPPMQLSATQFQSELWRLTNLYPLQSVMVLMNLYDSHDTDRLASMFVNPNRPYDGRNRIQDNGPDYSPAKPNEVQWKRMRQAAAFQMTFVGAPMIYYGSEAGMWGPDDPSDRMPMVWKDLEPYDGVGVKFDEVTFRTYQHAIAVRRALSPLRRGYFHSLLADDRRGVVAFSRDEDDRSVVVVVNRSGEEVTVGVPVPQTVGTRLINWFDENSVTIETPGESPEARPVARAKADAVTHVVRDGKVGVTLRPWSVAVLAAPETTATASVKP